MFRSQTDEQLAGKPQSRFRPPVNPILVRFRAEEDADRNGAMVYLDLFDKVRTEMLCYRWKAEGWDHNFGQEAVDHARKVLTRLAALG